MTVQEVEQNKRVATKVKDADDKLWTGVMAADATFKGQPTMKAQPGFPTMENKCGTLKGKPGVPTDVLGEELPGGSTKYGKHATFKNVKPGCEAGPPADAAPAPAAAAPAPAAPKP
jgi:hypothetical protein